MRKFWMLSTLVATSLQAAPNLERASEILIDATSEYGQSLRIFPDHETPGVYWWAPYEMVIATNPTTKRPLVKWSTQEGSARISFVASLKRLGLGKERDILVRFAESLGTTPDKVDVRPLFFRDIRLKLNYQMLGGFVPGDWHPQTSVEGINISESISLSDEENKLLLGAYKVGTAGMRVAMGIQTQFPAYLEPSSWTREYSRSCLVDLILDGESLADLAGQEVSRRLLLGRVYRAEGGCVQKSTQVGQAPDETEIIDGWLSHLRNNSLLLESNNPKKLKLAEKAVWDSFLANDAGRLEVEIPSGVQYYPAEFGRFLLELKPTD
ncbi:MAG TPA: hypothetical protein VE954_18610 [Oligoflexus sp.]|uniref:hypothetical protein n=1 Tax=Oligoflexus sp. TaxID=1971216 RepID=UPI002D4DC187|nr:hypothetical protein [Oligoflexus sp.]HYX35113.1 hypothetical protein [Oligoflexus sp.]